MTLDIFCQQFGKYISVEDIFWYWRYHAISCGMNVRLRVPVRPSSAGLRNITILKRKFPLYNGIVYMLPTIWKVYVSWRLFWYWRYHANPWRINVGFRVPVSPSGAGLGNIHFYRTQVFLVRSMCLDVSEWVRDICEILLMWLWLMKNQLNTTW